LKRKNLIKLIQLISFFILLCCAYISCKKKKVNQRPSIEILSPTEGATFNHNEEITVKIRASDDVAITLIKVVINDLNSVAITPSQSIVTQLQNTDKSFVFKLSDANLKSGELYISALISDGELETKKYLKINFNELPKSFTGFITGQESGSNTILNLYNADNIKQNTFLFEGGNTKAAFISAQQVFLGFGTNSNTKAIKLPELNQVWEYSISLVKNITIKDDRFYLIKADNYTTGYNASDFSVYKSFYEPSFTYFPECAAVGNNTLCAFQMQPNLLTQKKIITYDINTSAILKEFLTNNIIKSIIHINNEVFATHHINSNGQHQLGLYNFENNLFSDIYTFGTNVKAILKIDANNILIYSDDGLGMYNFQSNFYQLIINQTAITSFDYDNLHNEIYLTRNNIVERFSTNGNLISSTNLDHQPQSITLLYNK